MRGRLRILSLLLPTILLFFASYIGSAANSITSLISTSPAGAAGNQSSTSSQICADGNIVVFESTANNLVAGGSFHQIYMRRVNDPASIRLVSANSDSVPANDSSTSPTVSADGRYVAFVSNAANLGIANTNHRMNVYVKDMNTGAVLPVSVDSSGNAGNDDSDYAAISADGKYVVFASYATNLTPMATNTASQIYVRDLARQTTTLVSINNDNIAAGDGDSGNPSISGDGRFVVYQSIAANLVSGNIQGMDQIFLRDRLLGTTELISADPNGAFGDDYSGAPCVSTDGKYVAFVSTSSNLMADATNGTQVFVRNRASNTTEMISVTSGSSPVQGDNDSDIWQISMTPEGRCVAFASAAANFVPGTSDGIFQVYRRDRLTQVTTLVSVDNSNPPVAGQKGDSWTPSINVSGRYVTFSSIADNLSAGNTNGVSQVFHTDLGTVGTTQPVVTILSPTSGNTLNTKSTTIDLEGVAVSDTALSNVTWLNQTTGDTQSCSGTAYWTGSGIRLQAGSNTIVVTATDTAGHTGSATLTVVNSSDSVPPSISISTVPSSVYDQSVTIIGTASDNAGIDRVTWVNNKGGQGICSGTNSWNATVLLAIGANTITMTAYDTAGNSTNASIVITRLADNVPPAVTITLPTTDPSYESSVGSISISGTASDNVGVSEVRWSNTSVPNQSGVCNGTTNWSVGSIPLQLGANVIVITAFDVNGNSNTDTLTVNFTDKVSPVVTISSPATNPYQSAGSTVDFSGTASDNQGVVSVSWVNTLSGESGTCTGTTSWAARGITLKPGDNPIMITAVDAAHNSGFATITVKYKDVTAPVVHITSPTNLATFKATTDKINIAGDASDDSGMVSVTWSNSATLANGICTGTTSWSANGISLKSGDNVITVVATDPSGNTSRAVLTVSYPDTTKPTVSISSPTSSATYTTGESTITLMGVSADDVGVTQVTWYNDQGGNGQCDGTTSWAANNIPLKPGDNTITIKAWDKANNFGDTKIIVKRVDNSVPTVFIDSPVATGSMDTTSRTITVSGRATDNLGISKVTWSNSGTGQTGDCIGTSPWRVDVALSVGTNVITILAKDAAGNQGSSTLTVNVTDTSSLNLIINVPTTATFYETNNPNLCISGTTTSSANIASVKWSCGSGVSGTCSSSNNWLNWRKDNIPLNPGTNLITVTVSDSSNRSAISTLIVKYYDTSNVQWKPGLRMVSLPIIPSGIDPKPIVQFSGNYWFWYKGDAERRYAGYNSYFTFFDPVENTPGRGFWAKFDQAVTVPQSGLPDQTRAAVIHLQQGWNIIGQPFIDPVKWSMQTIMVQETGQQPVSLGSQDCVYPIVWGWNPDAGAYYFVCDKTVIPGSVDTLAPWEAFWVKTARECDLIIPSPAQ